MENIANLKQSLQHYEFMKARQSNPDVIQLMQPIIDKLKQDIIEAYPWTEEEILEKISTGKVPDVIACCY